jgi:hypothetical protein
MSTKDRRGFLATSTVISAGITLGAFTRTSLAAQPKTMAESTFVDRSDKRLDDAEIKELLTDRTLMGVTYKGQEFLAYLDADGKIDKMVGDRRETGDWKVVDGELVMQFPTLAGGEQFSLQLYQYKNGVLYKGWSPGQQRWMWFVSEPGKAQELA